MFFIFNFYSEFVAAFNLSALWELLGQEEEVVAMDMALLLVMVGVRLVEVLAMEVVAVLTFLVCRVLDPAAMEYTGVWLSMKVQSPACPTCRPERLRIYWSVRGETQQRRGTVVVWAVPRSPSRNVRRSLTSSPGDSAARWTNPPATVSPAKCTSRSVTTSRNKTVQALLAPVAPPASRKLFTSAGKSPGGFLDWSATGFPRDIARDSTRTSLELESGW